MSRLSARARLRPTAAVGVLGPTVACSEVASAHGAHGGGLPVGFAIAAALPIVVGLAGGLAGASRRAGAISGPRVGTALGLAFLALGAGLLSHAAAGAPAPSVGFAAVGAVAVRALSGRCGDRRGADAALAAVGVHRFAEGAALAVAYGVGAAVGAVGAVVLAGHAAVETAVVGRVCVRIGRRRALAAVLAVQACFLVGALVGASAVPTPARAGGAALAVASGVLLALGEGELDLGRAVADGFSAVRVR